VSIRHSFSVASPWRTGIIEPLLNGATLGRPPPFGRVTLSCARAWWADRLPGRDEEAYGKDNQDLVHQETETFMAHLLLVRFAPYFFLPRSWTICR
jgi:hypothetical protein